VTKKLGSLPPAHGVVGPLALGPGVAAETLGVADEEASGVVSEEADSDADGSLDVVSPGAAEEELAVAVAVG
jgi:hypothetical protein